MTNLRAPDDTTMRVQGLPTADNRWSVVCLNCEAPLSGPFCSSCGQRAVPPHPTLKELAGDAVSELSGWDGKLADTLRTLLRKPGELTRLWIEGKRASFISPLRVYLTASLVYFVVFAAAPNPRVGPPGTVDLGVVRFGTTRQATDGGVAGQTAVADGFERPMTAAERDSALADIAQAPAVVQPILRRAIDDPAGFKRAVSQSMSHVFLGLVPVVGLILSMFYRRPHYPEHLYFAIHLSAFIFIARTLGNLTLFTRNLPIAIVANLLMMVWMVAYVILALRRVYGGSIPVTIAKAIGIGLTYAVIAGPVAIVVTWFALT